MPLAGLPKQCFQRFSFLLGVKIPVVQFAQQLLGALLFMSAAEHIEDGLQPTSTIIHRHFVPGDRFFIQQNQQSTNLRVLEVNHQALEGNIECFMEPSTTDTLAETPIASAKKAKKTSKVAEETIVEEQPVAAAVNDEEQQTESVAVEVKTEELPASTDTADENKDVEVQETA